MQTVGSAQEALGAVQTECFDLVITDYEMPFMKGDKLAAAIKAVVPQQRILLITAYAEKLRVAGDFPLAVDLMLSKPFDLQEFRAAVRTLTGA